MPRHRRTLTPHPCQPLGKEGTVGTTVILPAGYPVRRLRWNGSRFTFQVGTSVYCSSLSPKLKKRGETDPSGDAKNNPSTIYDLPMRQLVVGTRLQLRSGSRRCAADLRSGEQCRVPADPDSSYCGRHRLTYVKA